MFSLGALVRACFIQGLFSKNTSSRFLSKMNSKALSLYEEAVYTLNGLQSNAAVIAKSRAEKDVNAHRHVTDVAKHLFALGIQVKDLDSLNIIHVAGTKGKGSTCAFTESILRKHGYKTGFYSSPHLISVNERIRVNGLPLDKEQFAKYFWDVYKALQNNLKDEERMPPYFMFLTIMAFYVFMKEQVQAAIIEVGVGGLYDCTNIIQNPVVVGISSLGIDHVHLLGHTLPEIAAQKAGIFKSGAPAFTVPQPEAAMKVLQRKAQEADCCLMLAPPTEAYDKNLEIGMPGAVQNLNASLAIHLAGTWLRIKEDGDLSKTNNQNGSCIATMDMLSNPLAVASPYNINSKFQEALKFCSWPGRFQTVAKEGITYYLDGAHTLQSMKHCVKWFEEASEEGKKSLNFGPQSSVLRVLLFNCTGERKAESLLDPLSDMTFDLVVFSPNRKTVMMDSASDQSNFMVDPEKEMEQCTINKELWGHLMRSLYENKLSLSSQSGNAALTRTELKVTELAVENSLLFCCLSNAVRWISSQQSVSDCEYCAQSSSFTHIFKNASHVQVLVTGSLHLVGGVLALIE